VAKLANSFLGGDEVHRGRSTSTCIIWM